MFPTFSREAVEGSVNGIYTLMPNSALILPNHFLPHLPAVLSYTRDEALAQAEKCASRALLIASKAVDATQLQLRDLGDRLERSTVSLSARTQIPLFG